MSNKKGFSTLFIVIIIGSVALGLILSLSTGSFWKVKSGIDFRNSGQAKHLSDGCAEVALEIIRENNAFVGNGSATIGTGSCNYVITSLGGNSRFISAISVINNVTRKLEIETSAFNPLNVVSWQEVQ